MHMCATTCIYAYILHYLFLYIHMYKKTYAFYVIRCPPPFLLYSDITIAFL